MITNNNKIIGVVCAVSAFLGLSSCSDFLEIEPRNLVILEQFWNEKSDVENSVAGCYEGLQAQAAMTRLMAWGEFRSDNVIDAEKAATDDLHMYKFLTETIDPSNVYTDWSSIYNVINRCNTVMLYAPDVQKKDPSFRESDLKATLGEVSALRDLCYFYLIRTFRNVPYTTTAFTDDDQKMDLPALPFEQVLDSLITDLENIKGDVLGHYPSDTYAGQLYQTGRITKMSVWAMLCEMYLWKQDYDKCIFYADTIISTKRKEVEEKQGTRYTDMTKYFENYPLIRDWTNETGVYGNAYSEIFGSGNSDESIFELTFMNNDNMLANGAVSTYYGNPDNSWYFRVSPSQYVGSDVTNNIFSVFTSKLDARNYENIVSANQIRKYVYSYYNAIVSTTNNSLSGSVSSTYSKDKNHSNWIIYRLTDIMLLKAEALAKQAADDDDPKLTEAFDLARIVNKRSIMKDPEKIADSDQLKFPTENIKTSVENLVFEERQRELMFEGKRWYDLVRRSLRDGNTIYLRAQVNNKGLQNSAIVTSRLTRMDAIFLPCNLEEWKVNKNLWANPSYTYEEQD